MSDKVPTEEVKEAKEVEQKVEQAADAADVDSDSSSSDGDEMPDHTDEMLDQLLAMLQNRIQDAADQQFILKQFLAMMSGTESVPLTEEERRVLNSPLPAPLSTPDLKGVAEYIKSGRAKNIIVMTGAGISVSAGIPDFRTPGTGLYYQVKDKYPSFDDPQDLFAIDYFRRDPHPFYEVAKTLYPDQYHPTKAHCLIRLLNEHGLLLRNFTQNIDTLEFITGIPREKTVFSHGSFSKSHCIECHKEFTYEHVREKVFAGEVCRCECGGLVKPDIVFFGEALPEEFFMKMREDFPKCDLLIVMGTSLKVQPFAGLISHVAEHVPRLLINLQEVGAKPEPPEEDAPEQTRYRYRTSGKFAFKDPKNRRDALFLGTTDDGCQALAEMLGWDKELETLYKSFDKPEKPAEEAKP